MPAPIHPSPLEKPLGAVHLDTDCIGCVHLKTDSTCPAFPDGIPSTIYHGFQLHDMVLPEQTGDVVFKPHADFEVEWLDEKGYPVS